MPTFLLEVPFQVLYQSRRPSHLAILPERFDVGGISFNRDPGPVNVHTVYWGHVEIVAEDAADAVDQATQRVAEVLWVMATWNGAWEIDPLQIRITELPEENPTPIRSPVTRHRDAGMRVVIAEQRDVALEEGAMAWRARWPAWMTTCLELNHLAVTSHDARSALVIYWTILDIMANRHSAPTTVLNGIEASKRKSLLSALRKLILSYTDDPTTERLMTRLREARVGSEANRIQAALAAQGVDATVGAIDEVRKRRNLIAHASVGQDGAVSEAEAQARQWVQAALRNALASSAPPSGTASDLIQ